MGSRCCDIFGSDAVPKWTWATCELSARSHGLLKARSRIVRVESVQAKFSGKARRGKDGNATKKPVRWPLEAGRDYVRRGCTLPSKKPTPLTRGFLIISQKIATTGMDLVLPYRG